MSQEHEHEHNGATYRFSNFSPSADSFGLGTEAGLALEEDRGTPTMGIYSRDGLWDEDDSFGDSTTTATTASRTVRNSLSTVGKGSKGNSMKGRSRSGTVSTVKEGIKEKDKDKEQGSVRGRGEDERGAVSGIWGWARRSPVSEKSPEALKVKKESKSRLKGKGRRGELSVVVDPDESFGTPLPTPSLQTPVTSSPAFFTPSTHPSVHDENTPMSPSTPNKRGSTWKKGVHKIFRSKSSMALRELSNCPNTPPPVPSIPSNLPKSSLGKPFSASTPPASMAKSASIRGFEPYTSRPMSFGLHPDFPVDPFQSSIDCAADPIAPPKMPKHSPSIRSLKDLITPKAKAGALAKTKSMANLKAPISAPAVKTEFTPLVPPRRMASMASLQALPEVRKSYISRPVESPPLLPPKPPYFPLSAGPTPSTAESSSPDVPSQVFQPWSMPATPMTPPPSTPLPPLPTTQPLNELPRSGSHKLLPRSRSTSMSLKSPPTSSSFYDLYEQLGIWPTPDKAKAGAEKEKDKEMEPARKESDAILGLGEAATITTAQKATISASSSVAFSSSSWEAAINAFPIVDAPRADPAGHREEVLHDADKTIDSVLSNVAVTAVSPSSSQTHTLTASSCVAGPSRSQAQRSNANANARPTRSRNSGRGDASSRDSSPERRPSVRRERWYDSSSSDSEEDDVPLSKLHPQALAAQQEKKARSASKRQDRARARANQVKLIGRNPGAETGWNGEGGVPADVLFQRLERVSIERVSSLRSQRSVMGDQQPPHARAHTAPQPARPRPTPISTHPTVASPEVVADARLPSPLAAPARTSSFQGTAVRQREHTYPSATTQTAPPLRQASISSQVSRQQSVSSQDHSQAGGSSFAPRLPPIPTDFTAPVSRSSTVHSTTSTRARSRSIATASNPRHGSASDENMVRVREPMPHELSRPIHIPAVLGSIQGKKVTMEVYPETTARDVLAATVQAFATDLGELERGQSWTIVELFAEMGCERLVREYEALSTLVKGWETGAKYNCLIVKQSARATATWQRAIPQTAPYLGSWVQWEAKKGKWSKRWLETRGGQVFLAKNEKNKDEIQINTLFFDVYHMTRAYPSPKPFVFMMKRMDPAAAFENPEEYMHIFSADEGIAWKLMAAIYDAKSYALRPHIPVAPGQSSAPVPQQRRPTLPSTGPLVDIQKNKADRSGFTGKGLLRM